MKKIFLFVCVCVSLIVLVNATVWEGAATAAVDGELPETGFYMATNSFPGNAAADVTNLENGRTIRVIVASGLGTPGLLAVLSKDAANAIGLESMLGRIRMSQPLDPAAVSQSADGWSSVEGSGRFEGGEFIVDLPDGTRNPAYFPAGTSGPEFGLALVPAETRPPANGIVPDPSYMIQGINPAPSAYTLPGAIEPVQLFSAPLITSLEKGKYYVQIAAYSKVDTVHSEIARIDNNLPVAIMNAGSAEKPVYRILIGPVNLGESGALLQRFRASYKDAFVRLGT